jgi:hypothetical protein
MILLNVIFSYTFHDETGLQRVRFHGIFADEPGYQVCLVLLGIGGRKI